MKNWDQMRKARKQRLWEGEKTEDQRIMSPEGDRGVHSHTVVPRGINTRDAETQRNNPTPPTIRGYLVEDNRHDYQ